MKHFIIFTLGIICCLQTGSGVPVIDVFGMEQVDYIGIKRLPAILVGVEHVNSLYSDVFQLNLLQTRFGWSCSPNGKASVFADVYFHNTIYATFGPSEYPLVVVPHIKKWTFVATIVW